MGSTRNGEGKALIKEIQRLIGMYEVVNLEHVYRESNKCVDALANFGCIIDSELTIFDSVPMVVFRLLEDDKRRATITRVVCY